MAFLTKQRTHDDTLALIRAEMAFLLERDERWFEKQLQARLLDEGCNFPTILAKSHFYECMLSELAGIITAESRPKFQAIITDGSAHGPRLTHSVFHNAIRFCASRGHDSARLMALAVTTAIQTIVENWQLPLDMFQEDIQHFMERIRAAASQLWSRSSSREMPPFPIGEIRKRLYLAWTTALLSKMKIRQEFEQEFDSIPALLQAMQKDHDEFCRFMNFCRERSPYFLPLVSRAFWRTLETLYLEQRNEPPDNFKPPDGYSSSNSLLAKNSWTRLCIFF